MAKKQQPGLGRILRAAVYSWRGFKAGWLNEAAIRQELVLAALMTPAAFWLGSTLTEILLLLILPWLTVAAELINSAVEAAIDRIGPERHELSGRAKDLGSACVFVLLMLTLVTWSLVALQRAGIITL